jgi:hypothetical protein
MGFYVAGYIRCAFGTAFVKAKVDIDFLGAKREQQKDFDKLT